MTWEDWHEITPQNMDTYINRLKKCTRDDFKEHCLFSPSQMEADLAKLKKETVVYTSKMD